MWNKYFLYFILVLFQVTDGKSHKSFQMNAHVYTTTGKLNLTSTFIMFL